MYISKDAVSMNLTDFPGGRHQTNGRLRAGAEGVGSIPYPSLERAPLGCRSVRASSQRSRSRDDRRGTAQMYSALTQAGQASCEVTGVLPGVSGRGQVDLLPRPPNQELRVTGARESLAAPSQLRTERPWDSSSLLPSIFRLHHSPGLKAGA